MRDVFAVTILITNASRQMYVAIIFSQTLKMYVLFGVSNNKVTVDRCACRDNSYVYMYVCRENKAYRNTSIGYKYDPQNMSTIVLNKGAILTTNVCVNKHRTINTHFWLCSMHANLSLNLRGLLCNKISNIKCVTLAGGTFYSKAEKYEQEAMLYSSVRTRGCSLEKFKDVARQKGYNKMATPIMISFANKLLKRQVDNIIINKELCLAKVKCFTMSRQEIKKR